MSRATDGGTIYPEKLILPPGSTATVFPIPGQISVLIKNDYSNGGTLLFWNASDTYGCTFAVAQTYAVGLGEILSFDIVGNFYLSATGTTQTVWMQRYRTSGTGN